MIDRRIFLASACSLALAARMQAATGGGSGLVARDLSVRPGDDFYRFANGPWLASAVMPADKSYWGELARLADLNAVRVREILEQAASGPRTDDQRKFGQLYASLLDMSARDRSGIAPIAADLARIATLADGTGLTTELATLTRDALRDPQSSRYPGPVAALVYPDIQQPTRYLPTLAQGGIGLPDRDHYLSDAPAAVALRASYLRYLQTLFALAGDVAPEQMARDAYALEEMIAGAHRPLLESYDLRKRYNLFSPAELAARAPGLDWPAYLQAVGFDRSAIILVADPDAVAAVAAAVQDQPIERWRAYLAARTLAAFAPFGPQSFVAAHHAFAETAVKGVPALSPPWRRAADTVNLAMGPAVGVEYLRRHFPDQSRTAALAMANNLKVAMAQRIRGLSWMSGETKSQALAKLAAVRVEVGGEAAPRDYGSLRMKPGAAWRNVVASARHAFDQTIARTEKPLDRGVWDMLPQTVNAQSNPILNKIMFPAGIMQPPLFDADADPAVNHGAIGMFIGHELSHLFDTIGAMFDARGRMANWWQPDDMAHFASATSALARQYDAYRPFPDVQLKGRQTLHENVADLAGLAVALDAYRAGLQGRSAPLIDGLSGEQRFFLSFAQLWRTQIREPAFRQMIATGTHSHGEWRVATVRNIDAWYAAFGVKPGDAMYLPPAERVGIW